MAAVAALLIAAPARAETAIPRYDIDGACAAYVDAGQPFLDPMGKYEQYETPPSYSAGSATEQRQQRLGRISQCVEWDQDKYDQLRQIWSSLSEEARTTCIAEVKITIAHNKVREAWAYDWLRGCAVASQGKTQRQGIGAR
jgi:hypothetical protein